MPEINPKVASYLSPYEPSLRERFGNGIYDVARYLGFPYANRMRDDTESAIDFIPVVGDALGANDAYDSYQSGDYIGAAANAGLTAIGAIPVAGDLVKKALPSVHNSANRLVEELRALGVNVSDPSHSTNRYGQYSSYVQSPLGEIRLSDHSRNANFATHNMDIPISGDDFDAAGEAQYIMQRIAEMRQASELAAAQKAEAVLPYSQAFQKAGNDAQRDEVLRSYIQSGIHPGPNRWEQLSRDDRRNIRNFLLKGGQ